MSSRACVSILAYVLELCRLHHRLLFHCTPPRLRRFRRHSSRWFLPTAVRAVAPESVPAAPSPTAALVLLKATNGGLPSLVGENNCCFCSISCMRRMRRPSTIVASPACACVRVCTSRLHAFHGVKVKVSECRTRVDKSTAPAPGGC